MLVHGNSLAVQWLGLCTLTVNGTDSIPGQGIKIPWVDLCSTAPPQKKSKPQTNKTKTFVYQKISQRGEKTNSSMEKIFKTCNVQNNKIQYKELVPINKKDDSIQRESKVFWRIFGKRILMANKHEMMINLISNQET